MRDLRIIPDESGEVRFAVYAASEDTGLMLLQRLYAMLLRQHTEDAYVDESVNPVSLLDFTVGANTPADALMAPIIAICCEDAVKQLDASDRERIRSFTGYSENGSIYLTLQLMDGTSLRSTIANE